MIKAEKWKLCKRAPEVVKTLPFYLARLQIDTFNGGKNKKRKKTRQKQFLGELEEEIKKFVAEKKLKTFPCRSQIVGQTGSKKLYVDCFAR